MNTEEITQLAVDALNELKGVDITIFDVRELTTVTDVMIVCSGRSTRHVKSLANEVIHKAKASKANYLRTEGEKNGEWIIVDLADVVVHIMLPAMREFYRLEDLWQPVETARNQQSR